MQVRHFFIFLSFCFCLFGAQNANAQRVTTNEKGEKIVVYPDGSWRYYKSAENEENTKKSKTKKVKQKKEKSAKVKKDKVAKTKKPKTKTKKDKTKVAKNNKSGKIKPTKIPKSKFDPVAEAAARDAAIIQAERAAVEENKARKMYEDAGFNLLFVEEELAKALESQPLDIDKVEKLESRLANAKIEEKKSKANYKQAQKNAKFAEKLIDMPMDKRDKMIAAERMKNNEFNPSDLESNIAGLTDAPKLKNKKKNASRKDVDKKSKGADINRDVMWNPPTQPCEIAFEGIDEFSGIRRKDLKTQRFFSHTNDQLATYIKERDYITCDGNLSAGKGGLAYLSLTFTIASEFAQREFGVLEKGSTLSLKMIDGSTVRVYNNRTDTGQLNNLDNTTTYKAQYAMTNSQQKDLLKSELDKVRVVWSTGYEDYDIYEVDFLINQITCLQSK